MKSAAGILFTTKDGQALFLKRGNGGDHPGEWCFPGGTTEDDESAIQTAIRETIEEIGFLPEGERSELARNISHQVPNDLDPSADLQVDFTTFLQKVAETFEPTINGEHVGWAWAPVDQPPEPLHPGCRIALNRLNMDELGVARAIMAGDLTSPQKYGNVWLFDLRITGTGVAYRRPKKDDDGKIIREEEFVYRRPENYLTPDFLMRCNGLPVIWLHPKKAVMNSQEFSDRIVGTMMLPYIKDDEVWGIAKLYDDAAVAEMRTVQWSTSPSVILGGTSEDIKMTLEDGATLLIEGKPYLLDHLAICERGVWDKGGDATGVNFTTPGDMTMTPEEIKAAAEAKAKADAEEKARADAEGGDKLDKLLTKMDSVCERMDAYDAEKKERADAEEAEKKAKADADEAEAKAKADAEEEAKRKMGDPKDVAADAHAKADSALTVANAATAGVDDVRTRIDAVANMLPKARSDDEFAAMGDAQAKADGVFSAFGLSAPRPADGESALGYRRRVATKLKEHSKDWATVDLGVIAADSQAFNVAESRIYADALEAARSPTTVNPGHLRAIEKRLPTGHMQTEFVGEPRSWMDRFGGSNRAYLTQIDQKKGHA